MHVWGGTQTSQVSHGCGPIPALQHSHVSSAPCTEPPASCLGADNTGGAPAVILQIWSQTGGNYCSSSDATCLTARRNTVTTLSCCRASVALRRPEVHLHRVAGCTRWPTQRSRKMIPAAMRKQCCLPSSTGSNLGQAWSSGAVTAVWGSVLACPQLGVWPEWAPCLQGCTFPLIYSPIFCTFSTGSQSGSSVMR